MDELTSQISRAVESNDYDTLIRIFNPSSSGTIIRAATTMASWHSVGQGEQRSVAAHFIQEVVNASERFCGSDNSSDNDSNDNNSSNGAFDNPDMIQIMITTLGHLPSTVKNGADNTLRQMLFDYKVQKEGDYSGAARILAGMRMEDDPNSVYYMLPHQKCDVYVKTAECFLAEDSISESDSAVTKAGSIVEQIQDKQNHLALILRYKSTYARVLDSNRKFLQAAQRYHDLSLSGQQNNQDPNGNDGDEDEDTMNQTSVTINQDELLMVLGKAVTCAILAPSGPQRQRVLGHIYNDSRLSLLDSMEGFETHSTILRKMYEGQILRRSTSGSSGQPAVKTVTSKTTTTTANNDDIMIHQFENSLAEHQRAIMSDGLTIFERSVVEHNMIAVSNIYKTIYVQELANLLGFVGSATNNNSHKAEKIAANMIMDGTINGSIDQVNGLLEFYKDESFTKHYWDGSITSFCVELNRIADTITTTCSSNTAGATSNVV